MKFKKGNVEIIFLIVFVNILIIFLFIVYILYVQITTYIIPIKQDLFYIVQNAYFSLSQRSLEYEDYVINREELQNKVEKILNINYPSVTLSNIYYIYSENKVYIEVIVNVKPIVLSDNIGNVKIKIKDTIKLKMMEVK